MTPMPDTEETIQPLYYLGRLFTLERIKQLGLESLADAVMKDSTVKILENTDFIPDDVEVTFLEQFGGICSYFTYQLPDSGQVITWLHDHTIEGTILRQRLPVLNLPMGHFRARLKAAQEALDLKYPDLDMDEIANLALYMQLSDPALDILKEENILTVIPKDS